MQTPEIIEIVVRLKKTNKTQTSLVCSVSSFLVLHVLHQLYCLSRSDTSVGSVLHMWRHTSVINETELLSSEKLVRLFIFKPLTYICGKTNPVFFLSVKQC